MERGWRRGHQQTENWPRGSGPREGLPLLPLESGCCCLTHLDTTSGYPLSFIGKPLPDRACHPEGHYTTRIAISQAQPVVVKRKTDGSVT
jgi:hypothetical protein